MGSEILDSSGGARSAAPELVDAPAVNSEALLELDELQPVTIEPTRSRVRRSRVRPTLRRWRDDERARRTTLRTVLLCLLVMAVTASIVEFRAVREVQAERNGRVAVDIRVADIRQVQVSGGEGNVVSADVQIHNLGPAVIEVVGLDITNGADASDVVIANEVSRQSSEVEPGLTRQTSYSIRLPCRPSLQLGFGPPQMLARVRTVDHAVHAVPVNLDTVNEQGGLLSACNSSDGTDSSPFNYGSVSDGLSSTITIDVTGVPRTISLVRPDVGVPVEYVTTPRLPATARPGTTFVVKVVPRVTTCPRTPLDLDALQNVGVSIGAQQVADAYLPALVAQAAGRACGRRR
jgi:hypothetical protein